MQLKRRPQQRKRPVLSAAPLYRLERGPAKAEGGESARRPYTGYASKRPETMEANERPAEDGLRAPDGLPRAGYPTDATVQSTS